MSFKTRDTPAVYILHENDEWLIPLRDAFKRLDVPFVEWHLGEGSVDLTATPPPGVFYNRMSASSHTRGNQYAPELTLAVLHWLENAGARVVNGSQALHLEVSKVSQYRALVEHGIRVPRTVAAVGKAALLEQASQFSTPFITKHNRAGKGLGIRLYESFQSFEVDREAHEDSSRDGITLLQEYIRSPEQIITRVEFIGGKFHYAVRVDTSGGFELCPADVCQLDSKFCPASSTGIQFQITPDFADPLTHQYESLLAAHKIEIAAFEFIRDACGAAYTYDINTNTNYNTAAERQHDTLGGMDAVACFLSQELFNEVSRTERVHFTARPRYPETGSQNQQGQDSELHCAR